MKNKKLLLIVSIVLAMTMSLGGTLAYLTDTDSDVNTMVLGSVKIEQHEYERVVKDNKWVAATNEDWLAENGKDKYGYTPDLLQSFTQDMQLVPAVFADGSHKWDDRNGSQAASGAGSHQQSWAQVGASGANQLFDDSMKNVHDKFVFVENTGNSDAYVRTYIAFEKGSVDNLDDVIMTNEDTDAGDDKEGHWHGESVGTIAINGNNYLVNEYIYLGAVSNPTGILKAGAVSYPSLLQVYMKPEATNEDVEALDGNKNGKYDIIVLSQAVQADGFADATTALEAGFTSTKKNEAGESVKDTEIIAGWLAAVSSELPVVVNVQEDTAVKDALNDVKAAFADGEDNVVLNAGGQNVGSFNYALSTANVPEGKTLTISDANISGKSYGNAVAGTVVFENCTFSNPNGAYSIHFDAGNGNVVFNNCVLSGWCAFGSAIQSVEMNDCTIKGNGIYAMSRFYQNATLNNCVIDCSNTKTDDVFADGISAVDGAIVTMNNCKLKYLDLEVENGKIIVDGTTVAESTSENEYKWIKNADR